MTIKEQLEAPIPRECISERSGLSYVSGRYVKQKLNEIFGWDGWSYSIRMFFPATPEIPRAFCHLELRVYSDDPRSISRDGVAYGYGSMLDRNKKPIEGMRLNEVLDFANAEAVTDALKRAAVSLGQHMGLELYPMTKGAAVPEPGEPEPEPISSEDILKTKAFANDLAEAKTLEKLREVWNDVLNAQMHDSAVAGLLQLKNNKKKELEE